MIDINIPGRTLLSIKHIVFDFNGTLAKDGTLLSGTAALINQLSQKADCYIITADTFGTVAHTCKNLNCAVKILESENGALEKETFISQLGAENTAAIGNGTNDARMLEKSALGILILEAEGASVEAILKADVMTRSVEEALEMLLYPKRLMATLRT